MYVHTYIHTYIHTYMHACMHACMHAYVRTYVCMYVCTYIYIYIYICVCVCVCMHMYIFNALPRTPPGLDSSSVARFKVKFQGLSFKMQYATCMVSYLNIIACAAFFLYSRPGILALVLAMAEVESMLMLDTDTEWIGFVCVMIVEFRFKGFRS